MQKIISAIIAFLMALFSAMGCGGNDATEYIKDTAFSDYDTEAADYQLAVDVEDEIHDISDLLFGAFFEDINFAADGGLYAEMVANRSFEFTQLAKGDNLYRWNTVGDANVEVKENAGDCLNENNPSYAVIKNTSGAFSGIENTGFLEGMSIVKGDNYKFSFYAKSDTYSGEVSVKLRVGDDVVAEKTIPSITSEWTKYSLVLTPTATANADVSLSVEIENGSICADMISLFPENTYKNRENGLRADLCQTLAEMEPKFLRFPGGCVTEGENKQTQYSWKDSIATGSDGLPLLFDGTYGNVAARKQGENIWTDHNATEDEWPSFMTYGLGFYEYFQLAEDIGAVGVPVLDAGLYCQMRGKSGIDMDSDEFKAYIQDMLDLVEFCRGDATTTWGKVRVSLGHEEPFELKYIAVGNENEGEDYYERYSAFVSAFNEAKAENPELYDGIELIYSAGASDATSGDNYLKSYEYAKTQINGENISEFAGATDQHYYKSPSWFLANTNYYDESNYTRTAATMTDTIYGGGIKVFVGEYAAQSNTMKAALSEAAYMTGLERNGDIVEMAAYAPLFSSKTAYHWSPNLIWFDNSNVYPSVNYYVQKLFSTNQGSTLLSSSLEGAKIGDSTDLSGKIGLGTWYTAAQFDNLKVTDNESGKVLYKNNFSAGILPTGWTNVNNGKFRIKNGSLVHVGTDMKYSETGDVLYLNKKINSTNYTMTVQATKTDGEEGFLIPFAVTDKNNNWFWNIGGYGNTISCLQHISDGTKLGKVMGTVKDFTVETGKTYTLQVIVEGTRVRCLIDGETYIDYTIPESTLAEAYQVVSTDETGDVIIKLVNNTGSEKTFATALDNAKIEGNAEVSLMYGDSLESESCSELQFSATLPDKNFNFTAPAYSVTVIRVS